MAAWLTVTSRSYRNVRSGGKVFNRRQMYTAEASASNTTERLAPYSRGGSWGVTGLQECLALHHLPQAPVLAHSYLDSK